MVLTDWRARWIFGAAVHLRDFGSQMFAMLEKPRIAQKPSLVRLWMLSCCLLCLLCGDFQRGTGRAPLPMRRGELGEVVANLAPCYPYGHEYVQSL
jgi:hypothetical protein